MTDRDAQAVITRDQAAKNPPWESIAALVVESAKTHGEKEFLRFEDHTSITFAAFEEKTRNIADALTDHGIKAGDRVALMMANGPGWPLCWIAILRAGAIAVPINNRYQVLDLSHVLKDSGASAIIVDGAVNSIVEAAIEVCTTVRVALEWPALLNPPSISPAIRNPHRLHINDVANFQYTSGTTGFPKACVLTHDYWLRTGMLAASVAEIRPDDVVLTSQPYSYIDPQWHTIMCLISGTPLVVLPRFSARGFWPAIRKHQVTFAYVLGTMPLLLFKQPKSTEDRDHKLRLILCSGIIPELHRAFEDRWGVPWREVYGMTETGIDLAVPLESLETVGTGAIGRPVGTKDIRIVRPDGSNCQQGQTGELVVKGAPMMREYYNLPAETAATIVDGWLHTGDTVCQDSAGWVHIVGRLKDMIRRAGENIACFEVESVASQHDSIESCAVTAIPDRLLGEEVKIFVKLIENADANLETARSVVEFISQRIAAFKVPRYVEFVDDFPLTPSERISKPKLLKRKIDQRSGVYDAADDTWRL